MTIGDFAASFAIVGATLALLGIVYVGVRGK